MAKNTSISLGAHFDQFVDNLVASGRYASASEVIRAGLRKLEEAQELQESVATYSYRYRSLIKELDDERTEWLRKNKEAIEAYNDRVENKGTFSDSVRKF